jgi:hypothetical protein
MDTRRFLQVVLVVVSAGAPHAQQRYVPGPEPLARRMLRSSEADQVAYFNQRLNEGLRVDEIDAIDLLILSRSSLVLPMMERKVEEVLKSRDPLECFTDKTVDPQRFVSVAAASIAWSGDEQALRALSKLIAIDEKRFGVFIQNTMASAETRRNPFVVAYSGLDIGDPAVDKGILAWVEEQFGNKTDFWLGQLKHWWAEAMVERYGGVPLEMHWVDDPIASRINRQLADSVHDDIFRLAAEAREKQAKK